MTKKRLGTRTKMPVYPDFQAPVIRLPKAEREAIIARLVVEVPTMRIIECSDCPFIGRPQDWTGRNEREYGCPECGGKLYTDIHPHFDQLYPNWEKGDGNA